MSEGLWALAGVIVGGLITGGIEFWGEWRKSRRERRTVARLLASRLSTLLLDLRLADRISLPPPDLDEMREMWTRHESEFARHLSGKEWSALRDGITTALDKPTVGADPSAADRQLFKIRIAEITAAQRLLFELGEIPPTEITIGDKLDEMLNEELAKRRGLIEDEVSDDAAS